MKKLIIFFLILTCVIIWKILSIEETNKKNQHENILQNKNDFKLNSTLKIKSHKSDFVSNKMENDNFEDSSIDTRSHAIIEQIQLLYGGSEDDINKLVSLIEENPSKAIEKLDVALREHNGGFQLTYLLEVIEKADIDPELKLKLLKENIVYSSEMSEGYEKLNASKKNEMLINSIKLIANTSSINLGTLAQEVVDQEPDGNLKEELLSAFRISQSIETSEMEKSEKEINENFSQ